MDGRATGQKGGRTMYGQYEEKYHDWVGSEWAAEDPGQGKDETPHWTKEQWAGNQGRGLPRHLSAAQMPEGEGGFSGFRHTVPASHWVPAH
jgi:hypothetical protein